MQRSSYWFPAKRYGWGWGLPISWRGWLVFVGFFVLLAVAGYVFRPEQNLAALLGCTVVLSVALLAICFARGEPPAWRWGK
ncbi:MAG: hypothetical protein ABJC07_02845 [Acidobacteriota bacterium]